MHSEDEVAKLAAMENCARCGERASIYDLRYCDRCDEWSCPHHWEMGDDVTGDRCTICGRYEYLGG